MTSPLLLLALAFFAGVAVATASASTTLEIVVLALVTVGGSIPLLLRRPPLALLGVLAATLFALGLLHAGDTLAPRGSVAAIAAERTVQITGVISADPIRRGATEELRLSTESVAIGAESVPADGDLLLQAPLGPAYRYGDRIRATVELRPLPAQGGSDFENYLSERGITASGFLRNVEILARGQGSDIRGAVSEARADRDGALAAALYEPLAGLARGIVTGRRGTLDPALQNDLRDSGLSHLVIISGSNVTILAALVVAFSAWFIGRRRAIWLALAVVAAYTVFVGADAPVVRAAIMAAMFLLAGALGRRSSAAPAIALAAALMVAVAPRVIDDLSFQLSFAATIALALIAQPLRLRLPRLATQAGGRGGLSERLLNTLTETAIVTVAAVAATLPLIALHFGRISLVALPANLLVVPAFPLIFLGSLATAIVGTANATLGNGLAWVVAWLPLSWFVEVTQWTADLPAASASIDGFGLEHAVLLYAALIAVAFWLQRDRRNALPRPTLRVPSLDPPIAGLVAGVLIALNVIVWNAVAADARDTLDVHVLDVGQGDAILAVAPSGASLLVDGGPDGTRLLLEVAAALPRGERSIDIVVASHPQADHIAGLFSLLDRYRVGTLIVSPINASTDIGRRLEAAAAARGVPVQHAVPRSMFDLGDGVFVDVLGPLAFDPQSVDAAPIGAAPNNPKGNNANPNSGSIVLRLRHGDVALLLTSDIEARQEVALARTPWDLRSLVLKVAHHGSATSTTDLLLQRVQPALTLISVGAGNNFGHPHAAVLDRLGGTTLLRTDLDGTITLRSDGETLRYRTENP